MMVITNTVKGLYCAVIFSERTKSDIMDYIHINEIPNPIHRDSLHATVMCSIFPIPGIDRDEFGSICPPIYGKFKCFSVFKSKKGTNCVAMKFSCSALSWRHRQLHHEFDMIHNFQEYLPHITLSYDAKDFDINTLPPFTHPIEIIEEFSEIKS